jgi:hypothetical protein
VERTETEKVISMAQNGGARPGAGRKPKDEKFKQPIAKAEKKIADKLPWLIDQMMELAEGVVVQEFDREGIPHVYQRPPDYKAIAYLADRIMGKPTERKELSGPDGEPLFKAYEATDAFDPDSA